MTSSAFESALRRAREATASDRAGLLQRAIAAWTEADGQTALAWAHYELGSAHDEQDELDEAAHAYGRAIKLDPGLFDARIDLAAIQEAKGDFQAAIDGLTELIGLDPGHAKAHHRRGKGYFFAGRLDEAIADFTRAIELDPDSAKPFFDRGVAINQKIKRGTGSVAIHLTDGSSLFAPGSLLGQVVADYTRAIELDPSYLRAYVNRACLYMKHGLDEQAVADFRKAAEAGDPNARRALRDRYGIDLSSPEEAS